MISIRHIIPAYVILLLGFGFSTMKVDGQVYAVEKASFSSDRYDDFSPVRLGDDLVFCSNRKHDVLVVHASPDNLESVNIWSVTAADS